MGRTPSIALNRILCYTLATLKPLTFMETSSKSIICKRFDFVFFSLRTLHMQVHQVKLARQ